MASATTDHQTIQRWAESKGGRPAAVNRTHEGDDVGIIRIMFPDNPQSEHEDLVEISWDEFFRQFEESNLALLYEEDSLFSKLVGRDSLSDGADEAESALSRRRSAAKRSRKRGRKAAPTKRSVTRRAASPSRKSTKPAVKKTTRTAAKSRGASSRKTAAKKSSRTTGRSEATKGQKTRSRRGSAGRSR